uniref:ATP synthase complex subunit 8 n=1 Tax=Citharoides macrolepis TaxID=195602 RepID=A0A1N7T5M6_9PLEU|nr:ATP synthase F0 subunit 8 [Citharoides macrolepis]
MPQLIPSPWLVIFLYAWLALVLIITPLMLTYSFPPEPTPSNEKPRYPERWQWLWR